MNSAEVTGFNMYEAPYDEWKKIMKMAKANENDLEMAMDLCGAFDALTQRFGPSMPEAIQNCGPDDCEHFDRDNDEQCGRALRHLIDIANRGSLMRVVWGMAVLLDPANKMVDPDADTLEHHPERLAATPAAGELERLAVEIADAVSRLKAVEAGHYGNGWFNWSLYADLKWPNYLESRGLLEHHPTRPELVRVKGESDGNV